MRPDKRLARALSAETIGCLTNPLPQLVEHMMAIVSLLYGVYKHRRWIHIETPEELSRSGAWSRMWYGRYRVTWPQTVDIHFQDEKIILNKPFRDEDESDRLPLSIILKWCKSPEDTDFETHLYDVAEVHKVMPASYKGRKHHYIYAQPEDMASLDPLSGYIMTRYTQWHLRYNFEGEMIFCLPDKPGERYSPREPGRLYLDEIQELTKTTPWICIAERPPVGLPVVRRIRLLLKYYVTSPGRELGDRLRYASPFSPFIKCAISMWSTRPGRLARHLAPPYVAYRVLLGTIHSPAVTGLISAYFSLLLLRSVWT